MAPVCVKSDFLQETVLPKKGKRIEFQRKCSSVELCGMHILWETAKSEKYKKNEICY